VGLAVGTVYDWTPDSGSVVSWQASAASLAEARQAPISPVPVGSMQEAHIRNFCEYPGRGLNFARLVAGSWDVPGRCDIRAMSFVINSHLRRHQTYHSWFEYSDSDGIVRHTIDNPASIEFRPIRHGEMTPTEWRDFVLSTPDPVQWDCFRFGIIQRRNHFTFFAIVDHLHCDPSILAALYSEILLMYNALMAGAPPITLPPVTGHDDFCVWERKYTSALTVDSPQVRRWIEFAESNGGTLPDFPLPLGDLSVSTGGDILVEQLMDPQQTANFESVCIAAGARFSGGLFACAALAQYELTGEKIYFGITPTDKRKTQAQYAAMGWFTGMIPFTVRVDPSSFRETARAAQESFDANMDLADVPFARVLELAPWLTKWSANFFMINYMDAGLPPLSAVVASHIDSSKASLYCDPRDPAHVYISVARLFDEVSLLINFHNNPVARESATRYAKAMKSVFTRVADGHDADAAVHKVAEA
jgi:hypothetical protein